MRQAEIVVGVIQRQLLSQIVLALAQGHDTSSHSGHMLTNRQVDAFDERRIDLPAVGRQHLLDGLQSAEDHAVREVHLTPPARGLDHLCIEQLRQGHSACFGSWAFALAAFRLHLVAEVG
jgi:hypothetical protein